MTNNATAARETDGRRDVRGYQDRCVYCGGRCRSRVCHAHRDLVQLEANREFNPGRRST